VLNVVPRQSELGAGHVEGRASTLDSILKDRTKRVSFINCDIEGHEVQAMEGAMGIFTKDKPNLLLETSSMNLQAVLDLLLPLGYTPKQCTEDLQLAPLRNFPCETMNCFFLKDCVD
jgi:hypothetical protein